MLQSESLEILKKLRALFNFTDKLDSPVVRDEYIEFLKHIRYTKQELVDAIYYLAQTSKSLPSIAEIVEVCKKNSKGKFVAEVEKDEKSCYICMGDGFLVVENPTLPAYTIVVTCVCKNKHKYAHMTACVSKYLSEEELEGTKIKNMFSDAAEVERCKKKYAEFWGGQQKMEEIIRKE